MAGGEGGGNGRQMDGRQKPEAAELELAPMATTPPAWKYREIRKKNKNNSLAQNSRNLLKLPNSRGLTRPARIHSAERRPRGEFFVTWRTAPWYDRAASDSTEEAVSEGE